MKRNHVKGFTLIELLVVIAIIAILAAILFPVFARAREKARQTGCSNNQRQIAVSAQMYAQDHEETMPSTAQFWSGVNVDTGILKCASASGKNTNSYGMNMQIGSCPMGMMLDPTTAVVTADCLSNSAKPNILDSDYATYSSSDLDYRHTNSVVCSYADGHVAFSKYPPSMEITGYSPKATSVQLSVVSAVASTTEGGNTANNSFDGNTGSRWASLVDIDVTPASIVYDMGKKVAVTRIMIEWETACAADYTISTSDDNATWKTISTVTGKTSSNHRIDNLTGLSGSGRYIKLIATKAAYTGWKAASIYEFTVWGVDPTNYTMGVDPASLGPGTALDRTAWLASSNYNNNSTVQNPIKVPTQSSWDTGRLMDGTEWYVINLGAVKKFHRVVFKSGGTNYAHGYAIYASNDGVTWGSSLKSSGTGAQTIDAIFVEQNARYIKICQTAVWSDWWRVNSIDVYGN